MERLRKFLGPLDDTARVPQVSFFETWVFGFVVFIRA